MIDALQTVRHQGSLSPDVSFKQPHRAVIIRKPYYWFPRGQRKENLEVPYLQAPLYDGFLSLFFFPFSSCCTPISPLDLFYH